MSGSYEIWGIWPLGYLNSKNYRGWIARRRRGTPWQSVFSMTNAGEITCSKQQIATHPLRVCSQYCFDGGCTTHPLRVCSQYCFDGGGSEALEGKINRGWIARRPRGTPWQSVFSMTNAGEILHAPNNRLPRTRFACARNTVSMEDVPRTRFACARNTVSRGGSEVQCRALILTS
jgi:hypothetical protein